MSGGGQGYSGKGGAGQGMSSGLGRGNGMVYGQAELPGMGSMAPGSGLGRGKPGGYGDMVYRGPQHDPNSDAVRNMFGGGYNMFSANPGLASFLGVNQGGLSKPMGTSGMQPPAASYGPGAPSSNPLTRGAGAPDMSRPPMISDPYRDYGRPPTMGGPTMSKPFTVNQPAPQGPQALPDGTQMISDPYREYGRPPQLAQSGPMPQQPQMIPGTNRPMPPGAFIDEYGIARRAPETPMNPGAGQFGQYGNVVGDGFTGTRNGMNFVNGNLFAAEGLNQGGGPNGLGVGFGNWLNKYGPMLNRR